MHLAQETRAARLRGFMLARAIPTGASLNHRAGGSTMQMAASSGAEWDGSAEALDQTK